MGDYVEPAERLKIVRDSKRPLSERFENLAILCEEGSNPEDHYDRCDETRVLLEEAGVSLWMPLDKFVKQLMAEAFESAALSMVPTYEGGYCQHLLMVPGYRHGKLMGTAGFRIHHWVSSGGTYVESFAPTPAFAVLGAICRYYVQYPEANPLSISVSPEAARSASQKLNNWIGAAIDAGTAQAQTMADNEERRFIDLVGAEEYARLKHIESEQGLEAARAEARRVEQRIRDGKTDG